MIGILDSYKVFEFKDVYDLAVALNWYADKYGQGSDTILIVDTSNVIRGILVNDMWVKTPNIVDDTKYYIYGIYNKYANEVIEDRLPIRHDWPLGPVDFRYVINKVPKPL